jgi:nucleotide-binding universal stress UspA family protein
MITTALVPLDGSPVAAQAVPYAQAILPPGGRVILIHVIQKSDLLLPELLGLLRAVPGEDDECAIAQALLDQATADAGDVRLDWQSEVVRGEPATEILHAVPRAGADAIVLTTHGRGALGRTVFGSVADRVARTAPVPVLLVRPHPAATRPSPPAIRRLVVPLDGSPLAEAALPVATELAQRLQVPVHLVQVINVAALLAPLGYLAVPGVPDDLYDETMATARREGEGYLAAVNCRLTVSRVTATWAVLDGSPFASIAAVTNPDDLVVMTSHGRGGALRWLLGSVAEKLVREAPCPVLLVPTVGRGSPSPTRSGD